MSEYIKRTQCDAKLCLNMFKKSFLQIRRAEKELLCVFGSAECSSDKVMPQPAPHHMHWHAWSANGRLRQRGRWPERTADSNNPPLSLFHTHTDLQLQHQCVAETKKSYSLQTLQRAERKRRGGERDIRREMREKRET